MDDGVCGVEAWRNDNASRRTLHERSKEFQDLRVCEGEEFITLS
jgi:hypothetical protein